MLRKALPLLQDTGQTDGADQVGKLLTDDAALTSEAWLDRMKMVDRLGDQKMALYVHQENVLQRLDDSSLPTRWTGNSGTEA